MIAARADVYEDRIGLHQRQLAAPDQPFGRPRQRKRDHQNVGGGEQRIQILHRRDLIDGGIGAAGAVDRVHARAQRVKQPRGGLADAAETEDPDERPADRAGRCVLVEHTSSQGCLILRQPLGQRQG